MFTVLRRALLALPVFVLLFSCGASPAEAGAAETTTDLTPTPSDTLPYPVYERFDQLAPAFKHNNDTTYVINFWATWCKPCVEELPYFEQLAAETAGRPVKILMVSLDFKRDIPTKLLKFVQERPFTLPLAALADSRYNEWIDRVDPEWGGAIPVTIVYKGAHRRFEQGQFPAYADLRKLVDEVSAL